MRWPLGMRPGPGEAGEEDEPAAPQPDREAPAAAQPGLDTEADAQLASEGPERRPMLVLVHPRNCRAEAVAHSHIRPLANLLGLRIWQPEPPLRPALAELASSPVPQCLLLLLSAELPPEQADAWWADCSPYAARRPALAAFEQAPEAPTPPSCFAPLPMTIGHPGDLLLPLLEALDHYGLLPAPYRRPPADEPPRPAGGD